MTKRLLELARREIGTCEAPAGSNCVKYNTAYYGRTVQGEGYPWCCVFLWWLFREAGVAEQFYGGGKTASCGVLARYAKSRGQYVEGDFQPGDLAFFCFSGKVIQHIGLVETVNADGSLVTIEGNTGKGNDANGGQVQRRIRPPRVVRGAYRPREEEPMTQTQFDGMMDAWLQARAGEEPSGFSAAARAWAEERGLIQGDTAGRKQYRSFCTREQLMTFLHRFAEQQGK